MKRGYTNAAAVDVAGADGGDAGGGDPSRSRPARRALPVSWHGLVGLTRAAAIEGLPYRVTANAICPGSTLTPHAERQTNARVQRESKSREEAIKDYRETKQPSRRFVQSAQIGDLVLFLCSAAASETTGTPISIDGGWTAHS